VQNVPLISTSSISGHQGETIVRRRVTIGEMDAANRPTMIEADVELEPRAWFEPGTNLASSESITPQSNRLESRARLYFRADVDIQATDQVVARGKVWNVHGEPRVYHLRRGGTGVIVDLTQSRIIK
jgi:hypothetical protein